MIAHHSVDGDLKVGVYVFDNILSQLSELLENTVEDIQAAIEEIRTAIID